jgi:hypothetical protein
MLAEWKRNGIATHDEGFLFNRLQALLKAPTLSQAEIEDWNRGVLSLMNSTEFRATLDRGIMSPEENDLTRRLNIAPAVYLKVKDLLVYEFVRRGRLTVHDVEHMAKDAKNIVLPIYRLLLRTGILLSCEDWEAKGDGFVRATSAATEETERVDAEKRRLEDEQQRKLAHEQETLRMYRQRGSPPSRTPTAFEGDDAQPPTAAPQLASSGSSGSD